MCEWGKYKVILVPVSEGLSHTGKHRWTPKRVDACIAPIVDALNKGGVLTRQSCCGHGKTEGRIDLQDGRTLTISANAPDEHKKPKSNRRIQHLDEIADRKDTMKNTEPKAFYRLLNLDEEIKPGDVFGWGKKKHPVDMKNWSGAKAKETNQPVFRQLKSFTDESPSIDELSHGEP